VKLGLAQVPEGRRIFPRLTVRENLEMGAFLRNDRDGIAKDMEDVFTLFPVLKERLAQLGGTLSGGEQQMLAISRALMLRPRLMLLDEPSFGLAPLIVQEIFRIMRRINEEAKVAMLLVEQNAALALALASRAYVLETGRIVMSGPSGEVARDAQIRKSYLGY
jgi:branched-chain amino acid transport system ATP-binding protein